MAGLLVNLDIEGHAVYPIWGTITKPTGGRKMDLRAWMDAKNIDVFEAARAFDVSIYAIRKWLKKDRIPRSKTQAKIRKITKGLICPDDWCPKE